MKKLIPLFIIAFSLSVFGQDGFVERIKKQSEPKEFELKYDKFKDQTSIGTRVGFRMPKARIDFLKLYIYAFVKGQDPKAVDNFLFQFVLFGGDWQLLRQRHLIFLIDGVSIDCGDGRHDGNVRSGGVDEWVSFTIPRDILEKLAKAQIVEVQLGPLEGHLSEKGPSRLKGMLDITQ